MMPNRQIRTFVLICLLFGIAASSYQVASTITTSDDDSDTAYVQPFPTPSQSKIFQFKKIPGISDTLVPGIVVLSFIWIFLYIYSFFYKQEYYIEQTALRIIRGPPAQHFS